MQQNLERELYRLRILLLLATLFLLVGLFAPMLTMSKFYFFENSFSVIGGIASLFEEGQYLIAIVVLAFSVLAPIVKIALLFFSLRPEFDCSGQHKRYLALIHDYGRWAMLDVLVVAVLIMTVKLGAVASIQVHWGLYVFAAGVILIMYLTHKVTKLFNVC